MRLRALAFVCLLATGCAAAFPTTFRPRPIALTAPTSTSPPVSEDVQRCRSAIAPRFAVLADLLAVTIICRTAQTEYAGLYLPVTRTIVVEAAPHIGPEEASLYTDVLAHELGHAWADMALSPVQIALVAQMTGQPIEGEGSEYLADLVALSLDQWTDYGDGWRHPQERPSAAVIQRLVEADLLPA